MDPPVSKILTAPVVKVTVLVVGSVAIDTPLPETKFKSPVLFATTLLCPDTVKVENAFAEMPVN
jgi:hypothetical protein